MADCLRDIGKCILVQCVWPHIKPQFDYWWCFDNNIQSLRDEIEKLKPEKEDIKQKIDEARPQVLIFGHVVEDWIEASTKKLDEVQKKLDEAQNIILHNSPNACNLISRYSMGKNAKKTAKDIAVLLDKGEFNLTEYPVPTPAMAFRCPIRTVDFESRKSIEKNIIDSLKKSSVDMIRICGTGGVGKTTMAQRIGERVKEENLFDEVVMVTVSQTIDIPKIQNEIAGLLKLQFDEITPRAYQLHTRLMDAKRKIIIFDDVWESLKFGELGIPIESNFERCKVLLTSRSTDACKEIKNKKDFEVKILETEEAWLLFKDNAGDCVESSTPLKSKAMEVAAECNGLPIALVTVGLALQHRTDIHIWEDSLSQLKKGNPQDLSKVLENVYNPLKISYDRLYSDRERYLFLLCCLFPEDFDISVEQLTWYSMGLGLLDGINTIKEARNRTHTLVGSLESRFLLIDVEKKGKKGLEVKMHDVIRDVAIYIGSIEKKCFLKSLSSEENSSDVNCNWMSVNISDEQMEVPVLSRFPKLRLLMLSSSNEFYDISHISFEGVEDLNVLSFQSISIRSLPPTLGSLENLQTLRLFRCTVGNISVIDKLTSLKIFSCCECTNITELPAGIEKLKGLRLLELNGCHQLQRIPFGIISNLFMLEELKIRRSFYKWETGGEMMKCETGGERRNASLSELERLRNLTCLEIEISDCTSAAQEIRLSQNLVRYIIYIHVGSYYYLDGRYYYFDEREYEKVMNVKLAGAVGNWIQLLARNAEFLSLRGDGSKNINLAEMENLRNLEFSDCSTVKKLVDSTSYLNQNVSLYNLKFIHISGCSNLKHVFSVSVARRCLSQLEVLEIKECESMEQVFSNENRDDKTDGCIEFPKLKKLTLENLPNWTAFCQGLENIIIIKFPNLTEMKIEGLPKLNSLSPLNSETLENTCFHLFCNPKDDSFCNLKSIIIRKCYNLRHLFPVSVVRRCLLQLEDLEIEDCESIEQVFWNEDTDDNTNGCIEFPKLMRLRLLYLPNLTAFCQGLENIIIKFPNITKMSIGGLPKLNSLSPLNSETLSCHDLTTGSLHFVCNPKVEMGGLEDLRLEKLGDNIRNIWCHNIPNNVFNNLNILFINYMNGISSLMSISIAKNLVSLEFLNIENCEEMVEVIERDDDDRQGVYRRLFPSLKWLGIIKMPKLRRFWQWNHMLELPLLEEVYIRSCTEMETFTLGSLNTPNIYRIFINGHKMDDNKDLNQAIQQYYRTWSANKDKDKNEDVDEEGNGDENENKDEDGNRDGNEEENKDDHESLLYYYLRRSMMTEWR